MSSKFIPESPKSYRPSADIRRQQIEKAKEQYRQMGYACELDLIALSAQNMDEEGLEGQVEQLELKRDNAYAAARKMDEELAKLPKPKPEKASK